MSVTKLLRRPVMTAILAASLAVAATLRASADSLLTPAITF